MVPEFLVGDAKSKMPSLVEFAMSEGRNKLVVQ